jgi:ectoine hydroxylase-related dioxygenase (phytanoyl-CoA dioxygenase family)
MIEARMGDSLREDFERDGFVVFDPGISEETLSDAVTDLDGEFKPPRDPPKRTLVRRVSERLGRSQYGPFAYRDSVRIQDAWKASPAVKEIARAPAVLDLLRELYGREPLPFQTLNFRVGTQQSPHADAFHFNSDPPGFMCGVWVALEDIDETSGPLVYYPGSHRLPEVTTTDVGMAPTEEEAGKYATYIGEQISRNGYEPHVGLLKKGQALLWASNLLHGGSPTQDPDRTRKSQVTHYYFEGCHYWTPMLSAPGKMHMRDPQFIT